MPSGSRPLTGSSKISTGGSPSRAAAIPSRCRMPSEKPPARRRAASAARPARAPPRPGGAGMPFDRASQSRWSDARLARVHRRRVEQRADLVSGRRSIRVAPCRSRARGPRRAASSPRIMRIVVDFPAPFGPDEARHRTRRDAEAQVVDGRSAAEPLRKVQSPRSAGSIAIRVRAGAGRRRAPEHSFARRLRATTARGLTLQGDTGWAPGGDAGRPGRETIAS